MFESFAISDPGSVRTNNEDYYRLLPEQGLYVVADGMGGAQAGEHASRLAADTVAEFFASRNGVGGDTESDSLALQHAFEAANRAVLSAAAKDPALDGMGTTLVAALESDGQLLISSVGDSRAYFFDQGALHVITDDQTWVNEVGRRLGIDEESLKRHPMKHVLTMAIGVSSELRVHSYAFNPNPGTQVLLCSDGLHGVVPGEKIAGILGSDHSPAQKGQELVAAAKANGAPDNVTVVLLTYKQ